MIIKNFIEPPIDNNNYLLIDEESREAALVDCSSVDNRIWEELKNNSATLKYVLLTHGHFDHIAGIRPDMGVAANHSKPQIVMNENDLGCLKNANKYLPMFGMPEITIPTIDLFVKESDILKLGNTEIKVIETPGHTQGGVCYLVNNNLFSGDTIFRESVGRCDLEGGDFDQIVESIENKIFTLPEDILIYPGHGKMTSVGWEKEHNRFM